MSLRYKLGSLAMEIETCAAAHCHIGGFHLHLLGFPFFYQFNSRIGVLVNSSFAND